MAGLRPSWRTSKKNWPALFFIPSLWPFDRQGYRCSSPKIPLDCFPVRNEIMAIFHDTRRCNHRWKASSFPRCSRVKKLAERVVKGLEKIVFFHDIAYTYFGCTVSRCVNWMEIDGIFLQWIFLYCP